MRWVGAGRGAGAGSSAFVETSPAHTTPLMGRRADLQELAGAWADAQRGANRLALVAGQPGAGKTRLVSEAAAEIDLAGGSVLYGAADESEAAPYGPFVAALADAVPHEDGPSPTFNDIARGAEPGREKLAGAGLGAEPSALFSAAVGELEHRCRLSPTALIIEDLHHCTPFSLQLLNHLARSPDVSRLLIIGSYRPTDLDPETPQAGLVGELRRQTWATHLELGPLDVRALRGLAASLGVDQSILDHAAELAAEETAGLPLYASELLRGIAADGRIESAADIPPSLQVLIETRIRALGSAVHDHLSAAAVAGTSFDAKVVAAAAEIDPSELHEALHRAERAGVLAPSSSASQHAFGHALTRRCLFEALSRSRRGQLHGRLALAMEREAANGASIEPGEIARHWEQAEPADSSRAAEWAGNAGKHALERRDPTAAVSWYERALELEDGGPEDDAARRCDLLLGLGAALRLQGSAPFREVLLEAAHLALDLDDSTRLASAVLTNNRGFISSVGDFDRERLALLELTIDRVDDETLRPLLLAQLALELVFAPEGERRHALAEEALRLARKADDPALLARVLNRHQLARWEPGNARERIRIADECVKVGARLDGPLDLFHGLHWRAVAQLEACEIEGAHRSINEEVRIAARLGDPTADWLSACSLALRQVVLGKLEEAETLAERASALGQASGQPDALPFYASQIASIRWQQGRLGELAPLMDAAVEHHPGLPGFRALLALARAAEGNADGAREVIEVDSADGFEKLPRDPIWLVSAVNYAHAAAEVDDSRAAESLSEQLQPLLGRVATSSVGFWGLTD
ncbi:MAG: ATP-binding protein, partial [Solirubrobacterales bacterium]